MKNLTKLITILSITIGFAASVSASRVHHKATGIMELPTFYIYASAEDVITESIDVDVANWTYVKSLDAGSDRVAIEVLLPGEGRVEIYTPAIVTSLVKS